MSGVSRALRDGIAAAQARQFDRARSLLEQVTVESPDDPVGWFWLAIASPSAGAAMRYLRRVLELDPFHEQARAGLTTVLQTEAQRLASAGARAEARTLALEASELNPKSQGGWLALAALSDDQKERLEALRKALAITPDDPQLRTRLRQALLARGVMPSTDRSEARECFREAAKLNPADPRVWQALAKLADTPAESVEPLRELLRLSPDQPHAQFALRNAFVADARALASAGHVDTSLARWHEAIALTGGDAEAWLGIADTTTNEEESARAIETAHRLSPENEQVIEAMARLERSKIDPSTVAAPTDAFARFDSPEGLSALDGADDTLAQLDSSLEAFARLPEAPAQPAPPVPQAQPVQPEPQAPVIDVTHVAQVAQAESQPTPAIQPETAAPADNAWEALLDSMSAPQVDEQPLVLEDPSVVDLSSIAELSPVEDQPPAAVTPPVAAEPQVAAPVVLPSVPSAAAPASAPAEAAPVSFELDAPVEPPAPAAPIAAAPSNGSSGSSRRTVMIVDDSPTIRKILGLTLERAGYKVVAEPDGESAIERLVHVVPDLILLDIAMPKIDGYEVCKRIKGDSRTAGVPVVMLSGKGALFDKVKGHMAGAVEYVTKPFETPAVLAVVAKHCERAAEVVNG